MPHPAAHPLLLPPAARSTRPANTVEHAERDRALVLDCLRIRDLGGAWLDHPSFGLVEDRDAAASALVADGLAAWGDFGLDITPRGRRAWADQCRALRAIALEIAA